MSAILPDHVLKLMSDRDRAELGKAGWLASECLEKAEQRSERASQKTFASWLGLRGIYFIQARSDKRSTIRVGHPDFTIFARGRVLFVEMKSPTGRLSEEQQRCIAELTAEGFPVVIARNALEAILATRQFLAEPEFLAEPDSQGNGTENTISPSGVGTEVGTLLDL